VQYLPMDAATGIVPRGSGCGAQKSGRGYAVIADMIPCPDCGGAGIAHCCDGLCAQPDAAPAQATIRNTASPRKAQR